jgi:hypothetical protein
MYGTAASQISAIFVSSGATPFMTKSAIPNGGVIDPVSMLIRYMTPNHTGLDPKTWIMGIKIGRVIIMMDREFR